MTKVTIACTIDPFVLAKAKELGLNISQTLEEHLRTLIIETEPEFKTSEQFEILQRNLKEARRQLEAQKQKSEKLLEALNKQENEQSQNSKENKTT